MNFSIIIEIGFSVLIGLLAIVAAWVFALNIVSGIGFLILKLFGVSIKTETIFSAFWLGWAAILMILQLWHFFLPVDVIIYLARLEFDKEFIFQTALFLTPPLIALVFWFYTAPDVRFAGASLWLVGAGAIVISLHRRNEQKYLGNVSLLALFLVVFTFGVYIGQQGPILPPHLILNPHPTADYGFYPIPQAQTREFQTESGVTIFVPDSGDQCWDAPLPCTPSPNPNLKLLKKGIISSGFFVDRP